MKQSSRKGAGAPILAPVGAGTQRATARRAARFERERRMQRIMYIAAGLLIALVVLVPAVSYVWNVVGRAGQPVAYVEGQALSVEDFAKLLSFEQYALEVRHIEQRQRNILAMNNLREEVRDNPELAQSSQFSPESLMRIEQQMEGSLLQERSELGQRTLNKLVYGELMRREAAKRGITLAPEDMAEARTTIFGGPPQELPVDGAADPAGAATDPAATPTPQPSPTPTQEERLLTAQAQEQGLLALLKTMSPQEFERLVVVPAAYQLKLDAVLRTEVPETAEQVHARHILVDTEEDAQKARERVLAGEDFAVVAQEVSKDTGTGQKGGDLEWQPREAFVAEFAQAAFNLPLNQVSEPVKTQFGFHVIEILGRETRPLSEDTRSGLQSSALDRLIRDLSAPERGLVTYDMSSDEQTWALNYIVRHQNPGLLSFLRG